MGNKFAYFSNTLEEFEVFAKTGILFWPRGLHLMFGKTKYQRERNIQIVEQIGDTIFVVAGSKIRGFKYEVDDRKIQIDKVPSIVYVGTVTEVFDYPIVCYRFTPELNSRVVANLPLQVFPLLKSFKDFLGKPLTDKDRREIENVIKLQEVLQHLLENEQISFKPADSTGNAIYKKWLVDEDSKSKILDLLMTKVDPKVHWHDYMVRLDTWRGSEFVKVQIDNKNPLMLELNNVSLDQGISTRLLLDEELEYQDAEDYSKTYIAVLKKVREFESQRNFFGEIEVSSNSGKRYGPNLSALLKRLTEILKFNKQIVLTGAPGTGKTYLAREICKHLLAETLGKEIDALSESEIETFITLVQFHPSYDYTDFIEGLRPVKNGAEIFFERRDGIFMKICREALKDENRSYNFFLIIDEINRCDLSKVFGEIMYCLEYRGPKGRVITQYNNLMDDAHPFKNGFFVPENVYIVATMNEIDRSVEAFDFALRRRFFWYEIKANEIMEEVIESMVEENDIQNKGEIVTELTAAAIALNNLISSEGQKYGLNSHYHLGPAYFGKLPPASIKDGRCDVQLAKKLLWEYRIEQILREYLRGYDETETDFIEKARKVFENPSLISN